VPTGAVRTLDFKGHYEGTEVENPPDPGLYERLLEALPFQPSWLILTAIIP
jgi:hypothetical protein